MPSFDPHNLLDLSLKLYKDNNYHEETKYRTSISRAYYAAFLVSREYLESKQGIHFDHKNENVHKKVITYMRKKNPKIGQRLYDLREKRNGADYDLNIPFEAGITIYLTGMAKDIIATVEKLK